MKLALQLGKVESAANLADGPTRADESWVHRLNARFRSPVLPPWVCDPWRHPQLDIMK